MFHTLPPEGSPVLSGPSDRKSTRGPSWIRAKPACRWIRQNASGGHPCAFCGWRYSSVAVPSVLRHVVQSCYRRHCKASYVPKRKITKSSHNIVRAVTSIGPLSQSATFRACTRFTIVRRTPLRRSVVPVISSGRTPGECTGARPSGRLMPQQRQVRKKLQPAQAIRRRHHAGQGDPAGHRLRNCTRGPRA
jgi:hypothetical protein